MPQINTIVNVSRNGNSVLFLDEDSAIREVLRRIRVEPTISIEINFPDFSLEYKPVVISTEVTGVLIIHSHSNDKLQELQQKLQAAQDELNGNQLRESTG